MSSQQGSHLKNSGRIKIVEGVETKEDVDLDKDLKWNKCQKES